MRQRRVTIREVAAEASVSITTVSHSLNGKGEVDRATRARVLEVAQRLGYRANPAARALREGNYGALGLVIPTFDAYPGAAEIISLDYYMQLAAAAAGEALDADRPLTLIPARDDGAAVSRLRVDGLIVADPKTNDPYVGAARARGVAVVTVEADPATPQDIWHVDGDNAADTCRLLDHLWAAGARHIALIAPQPLWGWVVESRDAYLSWCGEHQVPALIEHAGLQQLESSAQEAATRVLSRPDRPDGVLTVADRHADGVVGAARALGLAIPRDFLLASAIDSRSLQVMPVPVTAMDLQPGARGVAAASLLLKQISGEPVDAPVVVPGLLTVRASSIPLHR